MKLGYKVRKVFLPAIHSLQEYTKAYNEATPRYFERLSDAKAYAGSMYGWQRIGDHAYCGKIGYEEYSIERARIDNIPASEVFWHKEAISWT